MKMSNNIAYNTYLYSNTIPQFSINGTHYDSHQIDTLKIGIPITEVEYFDTERVLEIFGDIDLYED